MQRGFWLEKDGLVAKKWERVTRVTAREDDFAQDPMVTGRFQVNVTPEDADMVYVSESGPPDPAQAQKLDGRVHETAAPAAWFLGVDSKGVAKTGAPCEWRAPIRVKPDVKRIHGLPRRANGYSAGGKDPRDVRWLRSRTGPEVPHGGNGRSARREQLRVWPR